MEGNEEAETRWCAELNAHRHTHIHKHAYTHAHTHARTRIHTHTHTHTRMHIHTHKHTCTHRHTHTHNTWHWTANQRIRLEPCIPFEQSLHHIDGSNGRLCGIRQQYKRAWAGRCAVMCEHTPKRGTHTHSKLYGIRVRHGLIHCLRKSKAGIQDPECKRTRVHTHTHTHTHTHAYTHMGTLNLPPWLSRCKCRPEVATAKRAATRARC